MDIRRFGGQYRSQRFTLARATEVYATYYDIKYPNHERKAGRPLRLSPAYTAARRRWARASARSRAGSGRTGSSRTPPPGDEGLRPRGWAGQNWSPAIAAEAMATRERAGLFDQSSFAKIEVQGPGALGFLQRMCANDVDRPVGTLIYTQMLNRPAGSSPTSPSPASANRDSGSSPAPRSATTTWAGCESTCPDDGSVQVVNDVSSAYACFCLWGPRARDILQPLTKSDLSHDGFRYMTARELSIGDVPASRPG